MGHVGAYTSPTGQKIREEHHLSDQDFKWSFYCSISFLAAAFSPFVSKFLVEIAPKGLSGFYGSLNTIAVFFAQSIISFLGPFVDYMGYNYLSAAVSAALCISIWFIPESPLVASNPINNEHIKKCQYAEKGIPKACLLE